MSIKILVATHKQYHMPNDSIYLPVHVGKALHPDKDFGYQGDNEGLNISEKNPYFCELTAVYWAWKNLDADFIGMAHYRRHFCYKRKLREWESVLTTEQAERLCKKYDVLVTRKRWYIIETIKSHYEHTHDIDHINITRNIIEQDYPTYLKAFNKVMNNRGAHMFNMFIMKKELMHSYCEWLFDILFKLETRIDLSQLPTFQARLFGRISELLLDIWLENNNIRYKTIGCIHISPYFFWRKLMAFLFAKFLGRKYTESQ